MTSILKICQMMTLYEYYEKSFKSLGNLLLYELSRFRWRLDFDFYSPIKLVVAKCWDPNPKGYFTIPRTEPVRPIDPGAWVAHTEAARGAFKVSTLGQTFSYIYFSSGGTYPNRPPSVATMTSTTTSMMSSLPETERT